MKPIRHFKHNTCHFIRILLSTLPPACTRSFLTVFSGWKQLCSLYLIIIWNYHTICNYLVSWRSKNKQQMQIFINCQTPTTLPHIIIMTSFRSTEGEWWWCINLYWVSCFQSGATLSRIFFNSFKQRDLLRKGDDYVATLG